MEKTITFRPLRRLKSGKIAVASYSQWNRVRTADYHEFNLIVDDGYKQMPPGEYVHNHKGEPLFWRDYNPSDIVVFDFRNGLHWDDMRAISPNFAYNMDVSVSYHAQGLDCQGTPTFSHGTMDNIVNGHRQLAKIDEHEVLTVEMVRKWLGWFLYNLQKVNLQIGKL